MSFIAATTQFNTTEKQVPLYYFRKTFQIEKEVSAAVLTIGALGYYEVHLNGTDITKGLLAPYRSNPDHYVYYDRYEVALQAGKNVLAALLGNNFQSSAVPQTWNFEKLPWRSAPQLDFTLEITYADGTAETVVSDEQVLVSPSPILFNDLHFGEYYDARREQPGWDTPGFDDRSWQPALPMLPPRGEARICTAQPIKVIKEQTPVSVRECDGGWLYDFGLNTAGLCRLTLNGKPGQKLVLKYFEHLKDGKPYNRNIKFADDVRFQEDEYTCAGGEANHVARFTYHGFRYVYVTGIEPEQAESLLTLLVIHSDLRQRGSFTCDNEMINKLQAATVQSDYTNFHYFPTDCPHREKNGWTADASLSTEQVLLNMEPEVSYKEWLRNIYKAMKSDGQLPGIIPTGGWGYHWGNGPAWDNVILWIPYFVYRYRGDREILEEAALPIMRYLSYLYSRLDDRSLIAIGLGDWCEAGSANAGRYSTPLVVTDSILTMDIAQKASFIYKELGMPEQKAYADALAQRVKNAIRTYLINSETGIMEGDTQTGQAMGLFYGIFNKEEEPKAFARLLELIEKYDGHMKVGVLGGRCIFRVLADHGYADLALNMIIRPDFPSYGNWIVRGATTLWEEFHSEESGKLSSLNHHFWGDISGWFYRYLGGIEVNPTGTNIKQVNVVPCFVDAVNEVSATHELPDGEINVQWKKAGNQVTLKIKTASPLRGEICLPHGWRFENGRTTAPLTSGSYTVIK
ncbi:MAG: family 78 glycoside hydrolase catalytic domain [Clostridia bacterium]|nr:family 78 glycoside hydrolase catalytic domain [Clostridia bacterium]